jgi:hypothetical protein
MDQEGGRRLWPRLQERGPGGGSGDWINYGEPRYGDRSFDVRPERAATSTAP